jgi:hypothetical protein
VDSNTGAINVVEDIATDEVDKFAVSTDSLAETTAGVTPATISRSTPVMPVMRNWWPLFDS